MIYKDKGKKKASDKIACFNLKLYFLTKYNY